MPKPTAGLHADRMIKKITDLWKYVDRRGGDECWNWTRGTNKTGYGSVRINGIKYVAHRVAYFLIVGGIQLAAPKNKKESGFILHSCDNRLCCNPHHLFVGSYDDNNKDAKRKGRSSAAKGQDHPAAKLSNIQAVQLRRLFESGHSCKSLQGRFSISETAVYKVVKHLTYAQAGD